MVSKIQNTQNSLFYDEFSNLNPPHTSPLDLKQNRTKLTAKSLLIPSDPFKHTQNWLDLSNACYI